MILQTRLDRDDEFAGEDGLDEPGIRGDGASMDDQGGLDDVEDRLRWQWWQLLQLRLRRLELMRWDYPDGEAMLPRRAARVLPF